MPARRPPPRGESPRSANGVGMQRVPDALLRRAGAPVEADVAQRAPVAIARRTRSLREQMITGDLCMYVEELFERSWPAAGGPDPRNSKQVRSPGFESASRRRAILSWRFPVVVNRRGHGRPPAPAQAPHPVAPATVVRDRVGVGARSLAGGRFTSSPGLPSLLNAYAAQRASIRSIPSVYRRRATLNE